MCPLTPCPPSSEAPPGQASEPQRLAALHSYEVLDTVREAGFDEIAALAARLCQAPVALVSLVDERRQWFKAAVGTTMQSTPCSWAFCAHAIAQAGPVLVVPDATADPRFAQNPLVTGESQVRFYAGAPLVDPDGHRLGTLCVLDIRPRQLTAEQEHALVVLGRQVVAQLTARRAQRRLAEARRELQLLSAPAESDAAGAPVRAELEQALDRGELVVHYQPLWDVQADGRALEVSLSGGEALVRWRHPQRGLLAPNEFVPALERAGLAGRLGTYVLRAALAQLAAWSGAGVLPVGFRLHVNIAAQQLHEGTVGAVLDSLACSTGADLSQLVLEITESALLDASAFTPAAAADLVGRGVGLALDDFGTGFSSLTQLRSYPFDSVKIDRSFVSGLGSSPPDEVIVDAVVSMAHRLGVEPVGEGVETPHQLDRLVTAGCARVQGWLFGRAEPAEHWTAELFAAGRQVMLRPRAVAPLSQPGPRRPHPLNRIAPAH